MKEILYRSVWLGHSFYVRRWKNFIKVGNKNIFIGINNEDIDKILPGVVKTNNQKIHLFIGQKKEIEVLIRALTIFNDNARSTTRLFIHIPYELKDLYTYTKKKCSSLLNDDAILLTERRFPVFKNTTGNINAYELKVEYTGGEINASTNIASHECMINNNDSPIQNDIQLENVDENKDEIIGRFKATTPLSILKSFRDEDDIWDFIKLEKDWKPETKGEIKKNISILSTAKTAAEAKKEVEQFIQNSIDAIINESNENK